MRQSALPVLLYLLFSVLATLLVAPTMPPFQNADETNHVLRASQISHLGLLARRLPDGEQGGWVDSGVRRAAAPFSSIPFHDDAKVSRGMYAPQDWGRLEPAGFPNTAVNPPFFYIPAAAGLALARAVHATVLHGVLAARLATGAAAIMTGTAALVLADGASLWLFSLLLLPMSLALTATASQDALLLAGTALAAALAHRLRREHSAWRFIAAVLLFTLVAMARPPYAAFALVLLAARAPLHVRLAGVAAVAIAAVAWALLDAPHVVLAVFPNGAVDPAAQARGLVMAPWRLVHVLDATWHVHGQGLLVSFIGEPGWLDVDLPRRYHIAARVVLVLALLSLFAKGRRQLSRGECAGLAGILTAILGVMLLQYLTWTVPGAAAIEGLQGRYFIPPALMLAAVLAPVQPEAPDRRRWSQALRWTILLFPLLSLSVLMHALLLRYYF